MSVDWLRVFIAAYTVVLVLSLALSINSIGKPREPLTATTAGCLTILWIPGIIGFLMVWQRLGT